MAKLTLPATHRNPAGQYFYRLDLHDGADVTPILKGTLHHPGGVMKPRFDRWFNHDTRTQTQYGLSDDEAQKRMIRKRFEFASQPGRWVYMGV